MDIHSDLPTGLRPYNVLPDDNSLPDTSSHPTKLKTYLALLVRQGYLEQGELNAPTVLGSGGGGDKPAGGRRRRSARAADGNDENGAKADDNVEWKWGPRAEAEIGEKAVAEFITDVYVMGGPDEEDGGEGQEALTAEPTPAPSQRRGARSSSSSTQQQRAPFTQTQNLSATQRQRRAQASQSLRKDIERAAGSQLVN